ncbi:MAG: hypothetical protein ABGZ35_22030 [Planctomycetaceae bacterium]
METEVRCRVAPNEWSHDGISAKLRVTTTLRRALKLFADGTVAEYAYED